ncbi:MAG: TGS domain-containing protein [Nanoarchaeota archaeon]|nr:TGS domain-containing protein [Nanoarchaeota archaeon]
MPANLPIEYYKLEEEYGSATRREDKLRILEKMLAVIPKHKGTQKVIAEIRLKISKLKKEAEKEARKKKGTRKRGIKKEGAAQVCLIGLPNSGKSYILNKLCNKNIPSTDVPFETGSPEVGMLDIDGVQIQLIEIPSIYPGFYEKRGEERNIISNCDLLCLVINREEDFDFIKKEIPLHKSYVIVSSRKLKELKESIWNKLDLIKVYTKEPGKPPEKRPVALKRGATVEDVGKEIHKDFIKKFRFAKVFRKHAKVKERKVGLNFVLEDGDIVEFHTS